MSNLLKDFPNGPLERYRKSASFDWKKMKIFIETEEILEYQQTLYGELQKHPILFSPINETPSFDEQRRLTSLRSLILTDIRCLKIFSQLDNLRKPSASLLTLFQLDPATTIKQSISFSMFPSVVQSLGTERHAHYLDQSVSGEITGAYCLTEVGHGSNAKCMKTTATYDKKTQEFVLNTPNFEAAKCWAGNVGQVATHAIVYAQLITPDGVNHSLHPFCVKIRDPQTLLPFPGVVVGDMGEKIGLNGVDNGFIIFKNYRIPRTDLLNKTGDVDANGTYITPYKDPNKRYGASLGALSIGRVVITHMCSTYMGHAISIALRYAGVRKQFGPDESEEVPILEYQTHQFRLIPYLAVAYTFKIFATYLIEVQYGLTINLVMGQKDKGQLADMGLELHAISSASKPLAGWIVRDGIQECREACAGHGYLKVAGIGDIKNAHDANCTYEGENHVLIQQTSNWLLKLWPQVLNKQKISSPLGSINFLSDAQSILNSKLKATSLEEFSSFNNVLKMYKWLVCYHLKMSYEKFENLQKDGKLDSFWAKNESQIFYCQNLAVVYIQHFVIMTMHDIISKSQDVAVRKVLEKLLDLYSIWSLQKHIGTFYQGGYTSDPRLTTFIQNSILNLCKSLKNECIALVDVIAPPDFLIKSALGQSDGLVYKHLEKAFLETSGSLERPKWWEEIVNHRNKKLQAKL